MKPTAQKVLFAISVPFALCIYLGIQIYPIWRICMLGARVCNDITSTKDDPNWTWIFAIVIVVVMAAAFVLGMLSPGGKRLGALFRYTYRVSNYFLGFVITLFSICVVYEVVAGITYGASRKKTTLYSGDGAMISFIVILIAWFVSVLAGILNTFILGVKNLTVESPKLKQKIRITHISGTYLNMYIITSFISICLLN